MYFGLLGVSPSFSGPKPGLKWVIRNIGLNSQESAKSRHNGGGGGGEGEIWNIEIAIRNIGLNSKETTKSRHNGVGGGGEEGDLEHRNRHPEHRVQQ